MQECIRYNKLIDVMQRSLPELQKALKGLVVMSGELEAVGKAIALNTVPEEWEAKVHTPYSMQAFCGIAVRARSKSHSLQGNNGGKIVCTVSPR